jgi:hypothetical protein
MEIEAIMKLIAPSDVSKLSVYFTDMDRYSQSLNGITQEELILKLNVLSLLFDQVIVGASHLLRSSRSYYLIMENHELLEQGIIIPALRSSVNSFVNYVEQTKLGSDSKEVSDYLRRAGNLDDTTSAVVSWDLEELTGRFRSSFLTDIDDSNSLLRQIMTGSASEISEFIKVVANPNAVFSRPLTVQALRDHLNQHDKRVVFRWFNVMYHLVGAAAVNSNLLAEASDFNQLQNKLARSARVDVDDFLVLREIFSTLGLSFDLFSKLTAHDIIELRKESSVREFRKSYNEILNRVWLSKEVRQSQLSILSGAESNAIRTIKKYIDEELQVQVRRERLIEKTRLGIKIFSFASAVASFVPATLLPPPYNLAFTVPAIFGGVLGLSDPFLDHLLSRWRGEMIVFGQEIQGRLAAKGTRKDS